MIQRAIEEAGIPTVAVVNLKGRMERLGLPRAVLVRFPRGATIGAPNEPALQRQVLLAALGRLEQADVPRVLAEFSHPPQS